MMSNYWAAILLYLLARSVCAATDSTAETAIIPTTQARDQYLNYNPQAIRDDVSTTADAGVNNYNLGQYATLNMPVPAICPAGYIMVGINNHADTPTTPTFWEHDYIYTPAGSNYSYIPRCSFVNQVTLACEATDYVQAYTQLTNKQIQCVPVTWIWENTNANPDPSGYGNINNL